ncbi:nicotinate-nucleotide--dimethylbenzimidazole phosphoribosyltransferase [Rhodoligotrophos appendicifer]|uniref:nicotinate-nucleotide--dimethylbenzimidazole phosphoribosyltransferase n=1 Tax=Rhodoligotrophos appendicifer TaxID=987056 RepID=UPI001184EC3F|nr:nicotinate-nucleotide--dimethylbenzimidazole phosphoribosyltransferase [Rhodoligotrophos appendicifer]
MTDIAAPNAFDELRALIRDLPGPDAEAASQARARQGELTKPPGSLGRLEEIAEWLAAWQGRHPPAIDQALVVVYAGNHGVTAQGISAFPQEVTAQMVANFRSGGAAINQLCTSFGLGLKVFELALEVPTGDITVGPALSDEDCAGTIVYGFEAVAEDLDLLCVGEMGIGNTTSASALCLALFGGEAEDWAGPGTGLDADGIRHKAKVIERAVSLHREAAAGDPLALLARLGGRELAAICGAIIGARMRQVPVILDGFVTTAAAAVLQSISPSALDHCLVGHCSAEPAHRRLLKHLGKEPLLDLGMRLGEASGAALAVGVVKAAAQIHKGMATFAEAGVSAKAT